MAGKGKPKAAASKAKAAAKKEAPKVKADDPEPGTTASTRTSGATVGDLTQRYALIGAWVVVVVIFSILEPETYFDTDTFETIFGSQAVLLVLALGLIIPLTTGDFDLSIAAVLVLSSMTLAILTSEHGWALLPAIILVLAIGAIIGLINGGLVVLLGIDSFIVTLGVGSIVSGVVLWISDSQTITGLPPDLSQWVITNRFLGISLSFWYGVVLTIILWYVFTFTALGRRLLFVGRGRNVSRLSGINVDRLRWGSLVMSGFIAALAGVLYAGQLGGADPASGQQFLLPAFAAAFLGATAIRPGRFNPWGTFVAVYFLVSGITGLQLIGVENFVQQLFYGGALVLAVSIAALVRRRQVKEEAAAGAG
jgi:ribose transport system permease protein